MDDNTAIVLIVALMYGVPTVLAAIIYIKLNKGE